MRSGSRSKTKQDGNPTNVKIQRLFYWSRGFDTTGRKNFNIIGTGVTTIKRARQTDAA